ncbi:MAG: phospholipase D family protein [Candidatus Omnitrophica bacterium]|nr:phospholipase D family protein [Candidatus Omnitrophota bacterium]
MKKWLLFLCFYVMPPLSTAGDIDVYFSPNGACQEAVISKIKSAVQTIDIAMYYLSSGPIARALKDAYERQVRLRIVLDQSQEIESSSKSGYLIKHGCKVKYHLGFGLMHNKFAIIDRKVLITGSFNWTRTAQEKNEENLLIIADTGTIEKYEERFEYLWDTSRSDSRDAQGLEVFPAWFCTTFHVFC